MDENKELFLACLRERLELKAGCTMRSSKDYEFLSECVFQETRQHISPTTLKRLWGYLSENVTPRLSTLNILSQSVGFKDWDEFCKSVGDTHTEETTTEEAEAEGVTGRKSVATSRHRRLLIVLLAVFVPLFFIALYLFSRTKLERTINEDYVIRQGDRFDSADDYLKPFGILAKDTLWYQMLPHYEGVVVWGPTYHHPRWHNDGNADSLLPTITEYWQPEQDGLVSNGEEGFVKYINSERHMVAKRLNEVRITFMRGLNQDSTYTFLGIYRLSMQQSDSSKLVWERISDKCDLNNLGYLKQLRN